MSNRTRTIASFFTVAMAAMLLGAVVTSQIRRPEPALARPTEPAAPTAMEGRAAGSITLDTFRDIAKAKTSGVVNVNTSKVVKRPRFRDPFRDFFGDDMFERFFGPQAGPDRQTQRSLGASAGLAVSYLSRLEHDRLTVAGLVERRVERRRGLDRSFRDRGRTRGRGKKQERPDVRRDERLAHPCLGHRGREEAQDEGSRRLARDL